jgi:hypothetical protein
MRTWSAKMMAAVAVDDYLNKIQFNPESLYITPLHDGFVLVTTFHFDDLPCEHYVQNGECVHCRLAIEEDVL